MYYCKKEIKFINYIAMVHHNIIVPISEIFVEWEKFCFDNNFDPYQTFTVIVVNNYNTYSPSSSTTLYIYSK